VFSVTELLPFAGSVVVVETVPVFDTGFVRPLLTFTVRVRDRDDPDVRSPRDQVTVPPPSGDPPFDAETNVVPVGTVSLIWTFCAVEGPLFVAVRV